MAKQQKKAEPKYLEFRQVRDTGKTKVYNLISLQYGDVLGLIGWYPGWRRYVFQPIEGRVFFDAACLHEITSFIESLMQQRKDNGSAKEG